MPVQSSSVTFAQFKELERYFPTVGDFVIRQTWFTTKYGIISSIQDDTINVIMEGTPRLLFTLNGQEMLKATRTFKISDIISRKKRYYYIKTMQGGAEVWFV